MTTAATGNPMIPAHPAMAAQRAAAQTASGQPTPSNGSQPPSESSAPPAVDWNAIMLGMDDEMGATPPAAQPTQPGQAGTQPGATAPVPGELTPEQKEAIARANMEQPPAATPAQPPAGQMTVEQQVAAATKHLLDNVYALSDEQKRQLISEPDKVIPQLAAQMHVTIARQVGEYVQQAMQTLVPQMALSVMQRQMGAFRAEQSFFGQYPALANPAFKPVVLQALKFAKAFAPNATREQIMKDAAEMAAARLKITLTPPNQQQPQQQRQMHTPAQMPVQQGQQPSMPFMPAVPGGAPAATQQGGQNPNIFEELALDPNW